jgi:hypothetical protein
VTVAAKIVIGQPDKGIRIVYQPPDDSTTQITQQQRVTQQSTPRQVLSALQIKLYNMLPTPFAEFTENIRRRIVNAVGVAASKAMQAAHDNPPAYRRGKGNGVGGHIVMRPDPSKYEIG